MSIFQKAYDAIKNWTSPEWYKQLTEYLLNKVIYPTLLQIGQDGIMLLENLILEASKYDWTEKDKFEYVFNEFKNGYGQEIKDRVINLAIELIFSRLKSQRFI